MNRSALAAVLLACTALAVPACSSSEPVFLGGAEASGVQKAFSEEDKRIAKALSISGLDVQSTRSPLQQAVLCEIALDLIAERLRDSGALSGEQVAALGRAQDIYRKRAEASSASASERANARRDIEAAHPDAGERARFAIGCLRDITTA